MPFRGWRPLWLVVGFVTTVLGALHVMREAGLILLEPQVDRSRAEQLLAYARRPEVEDILFLGSSRVHHGIDAQVVQGSLARQGFPLTVYELGVRGLRPPSCADILDELVSRRPPRRLLVVGLETRYFALPVPAGSGGAGAPPAPAVRGEWESDLLVDPVTRAFRGVKALWHLPWTFEPRTVRAAGLHQSLLGERVHPAVRARGEQALRERRQGGERADQLLLPPGVVWRFVDPGEPDRVAFLRCLDVLETLPCRVLFVRMPLLPGFVERQMADVTRLFEEQVVPLVEARGFRYSDLNRPPYPRDPDSFNGETHMTLAGSRLLSVTLVHELLVPLLDELGVPRETPPPAVARGAR